MKRDFLKGLDLGEGVKLTDAAIDAIMAENGKDIQAAKADTEQMKKDLEKARADLAAAKNGDPEELQKARDEAAQYKNELDGMKLAESLRQMREKVSKAKNIPVDLLTGDTEEACAAQADQILAFAQPSGYPSLPDKGEPKGGKSTTREQFASWAKEMI